MRLVYLGGEGGMLQPTGPCPIADFLAEHGEGLHHVCLAVEDIPATLRRLPSPEQVRVTMGGRARRACFLAGIPNGLQIEPTEWIPFRGARVTPVGEKTRS